MIYIGLENVGLFPDEVLCLHKILFEIFDAMHNNKGYAPGSNDPVRLDNKTNTPQI